MEKLCFGCMRLKQNIPVCEHCGFDERTENQPHQLPIGTILQNQYLVGKVLGQGGFGITYMGWDQHLSIPVAIKEYFPGGVVQRNTRWSTDVMCTTGEAPELFEKHRNRFLKEARTLAQLSGIPEIVQIKSFFPENGTAYIVMEYVEGITLKEHLKRLGRPMTETEALAIMEPVLKALQKVHDQGLIHRDISPDNIMLSASGGIKLIDFGTVRYMDDSGKSKSTEAVLKPGFAPMEQYNTRGNLGTWTDVYAVSATFHYLLTGKKPADVHERLDNGESLHILRRRSDVSENVIHTLENGMKVRASERIQTIDQLYQLLYLPTAKSEQAEKQPSAGQPAVRSRKKKPRLPGAVGLAAVLVLAAVLMLLRLFVPDSQTVLSVQETLPTAATEVETIAPEILDPSQIQYGQACELERAGEFAKAAIAFAELDGYQDARERSFACWKKVPLRQVLAYSLWQREDGEYLMLHILLEDGTVAADCQKSESLTEQDYQEYFTSAYRDIVSIHGNIGLRYDGTLALPGPDFPYYRELSEWTDIVAIAVPHKPYEDFFLGLKSDGTVVAVGSNKYGECDVSGWSDIVAIHAGEDCSFGVRADGTAVAVGRNRQGMCEVRDWTDITAITSYDVMTFGLRKDGTVAAVGSNYTREITRAQKKQNVGLIDGRWSIGRDGIMELDSRTWENLVSFAYYTTNKGQEFVALCADSTLFFSRGRDGSYARARTWRNIQIPLGLT